MLNDWIDGQAWMPRRHAPKAVAAFYRDVVFVHREVWVVGDPPVGFMALDGDTVTARYTRRTGWGLGRQFVDRAKEERDRLEVWPFLANVDARRFYARVGFREIRRTPGDRNADGLPEVLLRGERAA